jgi:hypothetical protein
MALFFTDYSLPLVGLRDGPWKFIHELGSNRTKLFDLTCDPAERRNVAAEFPERVQAYRDRLLRWSEAQKGRLRAERNRSETSLRNISASEFAHGPGHIVQNDDEQ